MITPLRHELIQIGYHGCTKDTAEKLVNSPKAKVRFSTNEYDWLGNGFYIWENSYERAHQFIVEKLNREHKESNEGVVLGVAYTLKSCLDMTTEEGLSTLKFAYQELVTAKIQLKENTKFNQTQHDFLNRQLDCQVVNYACYLAKELDIPIDSARGVFWEGEDLYETAGFKTKNHIQICIKNAQCLLGFFYPRLDQ